MKPNYSDRIGNSLGSCIIEMIFYEVGLSCRDGTCEGEGAGVGVLCEESVLEIN